MGDEKLRKTKKKRKQNHHAVVRIQTHVRARYNSRKKAAHEAKAKELEQEIKRKEEDAIDIDKIPEGSPTEDTKPFSADTEDFVRVNLDHQWGEDWKNFAAGDNL